MAGNQPSGDGVDWQAKQAMADIKLSNSFVNTSGAYESHAGDTYGYHQGSQLMQNPQRSEANGADNNGSSKPVGIPVSPEELKMYGQRVMRPGQVQDFGAVLLVSMGNSETEAPRGTILAASVNSINVLAVEAGTLIDTNLFDSATSPFDPASLSSIEASLDSCDVSVQAPLIGTLFRHEEAARKAFLILHQTEEGVVIDVEPIQGEVSTLLQGSLQTHSLAKSAISRLQELAGATTEEQCQATVEEVQKLTGYDRIMIYKFHPDQHGEVVAEAMSERVPDALLHLHFPATDIPQANRGIFMKMRSRMIADVAAPSVKLLQSPRLEENIILAGSQLRGVSGCHGQYLQNMGVGATLVLSIVTGVPRGDHNSPHEAQSTGAPPPRSALWGLLVCHHYSPHHVNFDHRAAVEFLIKVFSLQLGRSLDSLSASEQQKVIRAQGAVCNVLKAFEEHRAFTTSLSDSLVSNLFHGTDPEVMLQVANASGCAMYLGGKWQLLGNCPTAEQLDHLANWMCCGSERKQLLRPGGHWGTISLNDSGYPNAKEIRQTAAGILAVDLNESLAISSEEGRAHADRWFTFWVRGEMMEEIMWAGDKSTPQARATGHEMTPRGSFEAMKELIQLQCRPWSAHEVDGTHAIKFLLQDAIRLCEEGKTTSRILVALNQERLRNMDELSKVADELRGVLAAADVPIIKLDRKLCITDLNPCAEPLVIAAGNDGDIKGKPFAKVMNCERSALVAVALREALDTGIEPEPLEVKLLPLAGAKPDTSYDEQNPVDPSHSESLREILIFVHIKRTTMGEPDGLTLVCRDVTQQATLMRDVAAREHDCEDLLQYSTSAMFCVDTEARVTEWNTTMELLTCLGKDAAVEKLAVGEVFGPNGLLIQEPHEGNADPMTELSAMMVSVLGHPASPDMPAVSWHEADKAAAAGRAVSLRFKKQTRGSTNARSGAHVDVSVTCRPRRGAQDEVLGAFFFVQDLTLPKSLEKAIAVQMAAEAAADAKTRHISFLCHEIRNPVNGILATVAALEDVMDPDTATNSDSGIAMDEVQDLVRTTKTCTEQLRRTVDDILDIHKLEENKLQIKVAPLNLAEVIDNVRDQVCRAAHEKGLNWENLVDPPELNDKFFMGDEVRIKQILTNFCWNSVKFTSKGDIKLVVSAEETERPGCMRLFWKVIDTGKGMTQKTQEMLFERYSMADHKVGKYGGSGLGLSICRSLAALMDGHVHCMSTIGQGSTFILELDLDVVPPEKAPLRKRRTLRQLFKAPPPIPKENSGVEASAVPQAEALSQSTVALPVAPQPQPAAALPVLHQQPPATVPIAAPLPSSSPYPVGREHWSTSVIREIVSETSVAVLVEIRMGDVVRQHWGGAVVGPSGPGCALGLANEDAIQRCADQCTQLVPGVSDRAAAAADPATSTTVAAAPVEAPAAVDVAPVATVAVADHFKPPLQPETQPAPVSAPVPAPEPVESQEATRVSITAATPPEAPAAPAPAPEMESGELLTVLAVDDDTVNRKMVHRALTRGGLKVTLGEDGQDVINMCVRNNMRFDILLVDENMRHVNGTTATLALRKHERAQGIPPMPIITTTGNSSPQDIARYYSCGLDGIVPKAFNFRMLVPALRSYYAHRRENGPERDTLANLTSDPTKADPDLLSRIHENRETSLIFGELEVFGKLDE